MVKPAAVERRVKALREAQYRPLYDELVNYHFVESKESWVEVCLLLHIW